MNKTAVSRKAIITFGAVFVILAFLPFVMSSPYHMHLVIMTCINIFLGLSFALLYSAGLLTMAVAGFWAIGAYTSALLVLKLGLSFWVALPLAGVMAAFVALATGLVIVRIAGVTFLILTLVLNMILPELFGHFDFFGGWAGILGIPGPDSIGPIVFMGKTPYYYLVVILLLINMLAFRALYSSRVGRAWNAIKLNPQLAETLGINLYWYRLLAFVISSASAGIAGSFYAHYFQSLEPGMFSAFKSINVQVFSILGGLNYYLLGPAIGAAIMTVVPELLRVGKEIEPIITGAILVFLVLFLPGGILSVTDRFRYLLFKLARKVKPEEGVDHPKTTRGG
jgi:branched-chain amino acid transport system permease protein